LSSFRHGYSRSETTTKLTHDRKVVQEMYIGLGTVLVIVLIILLIYMLA
jgi:hypothetical protein